jgi:hypothetical protein
MNELTDPTAEEIQDSIESSVREAKHWLGSWDELRKLIDQLEDNEQEAAFDRANEDY